MALCLLATRSYSRGVQLIKERCSVVDYEYYPSMLSFIGCRDLEYLQDQLNEQQNSEATPLYQSATSIHMLSKRIDISRMLDEMMVLVAQGTDYSA